MIDTVLNLLFRCSHRRLTRPITSLSKVGQPHGEPYVVCLDCGKQFSYDFKTMTIGKPIDTSHEAYVLPPDMPDARKKKVKVALIASLPLVVLLGSALKSRKPAKPTAAPERSGREKSPPEATPSA
jgi:hypothetical protein